MKESKTQPVEVHYKGKVARLQIIYFDNWEEPLRLWGEKFLLTLINSGIAKRARTSATNKFTRGISAKEIEKRMNGGKWQPIGQSGKDRKLQAIAKKLSALSPEEYDAVIAHKEKKK